MKTAASILLILSIGSSLCNGWSFPSVHQPISRKDALAAGGFAATLLVGNQKALSFDGSGSSAYAGKSVQGSKEALVESCKKRIIEDARDIVALGKAIDRGETDGEAWIAVFIQYPRREPDAAGRLYSARIDLIGEDDTGGSGFLLAGTFAKKGKPIETLPQFKTIKAVAATLPSVKSAGRSGKLDKAKKAYSKASEALSAYLETVGLPGSLNDPLYN